MEARGVARCQYIIERGRGAVMQIGWGEPQPAQGGRIHAPQFPTQAFTRGVGDGSDLVAHAQGAVGEFLTTMTSRTARGDEDGATGCALLGQTAVGRAEG